MHRYKNIAITGARGAGKSTLAMWLLEQLGLPWTGFQTERIAMTDAGPLYALVEVATGRAAPISQRLPEGIRGIPESFDGFGLQVLRGVLAASAPVVLLDEIGRFERNSPGFLAGLEDILDSSKTVIAVLKQEQLPHIRKIRSRPDTLVVDLDLCSRAEAREALKKWLENL